MELDQIRVYLDSPDSQERMKAIVELRNYSPSVVVPLLKQRMYDKEFVIRSFVAIGLGKKQTEEAFNALLDIINYEKDYNVVAEAANSLAKYGERSLDYLLRLFQQNTNWLIRQSIFAAMEDIDVPEARLQMCIWGLEGDDLVVKLAAIENLGKLAKTAQKSQALEILLSLSTNEAVQIRAQVAKVIREFESVQGENIVEKTLGKLRQDQDYRVIAATLENLL